MYRNRVGPEGYDNLPVVCCIRRTVRKLLFVYGFRGGIYREFLEVRRVICRFLLSLLYPDEELNDLWCAFYRVERIDRQVDGYGDIG